MSPEQIVQEARLWCGTPYRHGAGLRGIGVDCGQLVWRVYEACGAEADLAPPAYAPDWMAHGADLLQPVVERFFRRVATPEPGDVLLFRYGRVYAHAAMATTVAPLRIVHAYQPAGLTLEERLDGNAALSAPHRRLLLYRWKEFS